MSRGGQLANFFSVKSPAPKVGDGATVFHYTDRSAATVVKVSKSGKTAWIQNDMSKRVDKGGMTDSGQKYEFTRNPNGALLRVSKRRDGQWKLSNDGRKVAFGIRDAYHDFSF